MAVGYSRIVEFSGTASTKTCVELPACPRGLLEKLVITQLTGTSAGGDFNVYDRKGACANANDLNVALSGGVTSVADSTDNPGQALITTDADHGLKVGDTIEVKGNTVSAYNVTHTVTVVPSATQVETDIAYTSGGTGGLWQTSPYMATRNPASHVVFSGTVSSGSFSNHNIDRGYENRDNQSETMRARYQALWLEYEPDQTGTFEVAITTESDAML